MLVLPNVVKKPKIVFYCSVIQTTNITYILQFCRERELHHKFSKSKKHTEQKQEQKREKEEEMSNSLTI